MQVGWDAGSTHEMRVMWRGAVMVSQSWGVREQITVESREQERSCPVMGGKVYRLLDSYCGGRAGYGGPIGRRLEKSEKSQSVSHGRWVGLLFPVPAADTLGQAQDIRAGAAGCKWMGPKQVGQRRQTPNA